MPVTAPVVVVVRPRWPARCTHRLPDHHTAGRVVGLFRLTFRDPGIVIEKVQGEAVYLILAMTGDKLLRFKPQNLATGLPVRHLEAAT